MHEHDPLILSYTHMKELPREKDALHTLRKIASLVKPIMRARNWRVGVLSELPPTQQANLLGLNHNRGQKILVRLRHASDHTQFIPIEQVVDTLLHELSHIVYGPHDAKFHALWDQLRDEHEALIRKGYSGEGFLSEGQRLGGRNISRYEVRRLAPVAAEKRRELAARPGRKLGGAAPRQGEDLRTVIISAIERRNQTLRGCGNTGHNEREIEKISDAATRNGFKTQAEEDAANEAAIAQAMWELVQEDEKQKYGSSYVIPIAKNPAGRPAGSGEYHDLASARVFVAGEDAREDEDVASPPRPKPSTPAPVSLGPKPTARVSPDTVDGWVCGICTLHNQLDFLCCDACGVERPEQVTRQLAARSSKRTRDMVDLTSPTRPPCKASKRKGKRPIPQFGLSSGPPTWQCSFCGHVMERQWWICSTCGNMKETSR